MADQGLGGADAEGGMVMQLKKLLETWRNFNNINCVLAPTFNATLYLFYP